MKMKRIISLLIVLMLLLTACNSNKLTMYRETTFDVGFSTPFTLMLYTESEEEFLEHFENMKEQVRFYNDHFDTFKDYEGVNNLKTVNDNAGIKPVKVDPVVIELLEEAQSWAVKTDLLFDPTLGSVLEIWHEYRERGIELNREGKFGPSPSLEELEEANKSIGWEFVEIDKEASTVYITNKETSIDIGAIAKGWAVEKVAQKLEADGIQHGIVNGGGNVRLIGSKLGANWSVGITNPDGIQEDSLLSVVFDQDMSVVTSGDYERYFIDDQGRHQNHLVNPKTLQPAVYSRSVTITVKDSGMADVLSTVFSMVELKDAEALMKKLDIPDLGLVFIKDKIEADDYGFNHLEKDGKHIYYNDVIKDHLKK